MAIDVKIDYPTKCVDRFVVLKDTAFSDSDDSHQSVILDLANVVFFRHDVQKLDARWDE